MCMSVIFLLLFFFSRESFIARSCNETNVIFKSIAVFILNLVRGLFSHFSKKPSFVVFLLFLFCSLLISLWFFFLEQEMATHSNILAWRIPWTEKPGGIQSTGLQKVRHNWATFVLKFPLLFSFWWGGVTLLLFSQLFELDV